MVVACLSLVPWLPAQDVLLGDFSAPGEIEKRLAAARAEIEALPDDADPALRDRLQLLEFACQHHLAAVDTASKARSARDQAAKAATSWRGLPQPPPYSVILLDQVRQSLMRLARSKQAGEVQNRIFVADLDGARKQLLQHQQSERRLLDATGTGTPDARLAAQRDMRREQVAARIAAEQVARLSLRLEAEQAELEMIGAQIQLAELQMEAMEGSVIFPKQDLDAILKRIANERAEALGHVKSTASATSQPDPLLPWKVEFLDLETAFWEARFAGFDTRDSSIRKESLSKIRGLGKRVDDWIRIARIRLEGGTTAAAEIDPTQLRDSLQRIETMERLIASAMEDLRGGRRGTPVLDGISVSFASLWNMELYLAEETDIIDGKIVPTYRAVTIGKLVRLALILTVGWLILSFVSRRLNTLISRRSKLPESAAGIVGNSIFVLGLTLLLLYGMNTVHIPLTVFAFLGGALAIGLGFGTQTLLKNFISGIILIFERPLKVGDVVEVAGITGSIRSIGIRASVVQHFDGIETLVPNSILLENELTNWTFSNTVIRHSVTVGVAYGSPARQVASVLGEVADSHGLVKEVPAPEVRLDDFGPDSLTFTLLFWLDAAVIPRAQLASDLRFMIDKAFAEAGIVIAFPQRHLHFDPDIPLRVELSRKPAAIRS